jgi:colanic acid/amylovoran biosynthesis glycosyltransferase
MAFLEKIDSNSDMHPRDGRPRLRIAYFVGSFPHVSETFITNQIVGMAARGHQVDIFTTVPKKNDHIPAGVRRFRLMERTRFLFGSTNYCVRALRAAWLLLRFGWLIPGAVLRPLNVSRRAGSAISLGLLAAALTVLGRQRGRFDIVHCQFGVYGELALALMDLGALSGKLAVSFRGYDATKYLRSHPRAYDDLFRRADLILPVSETLAQRLIAAGCDRSKIMIHRSGIEFVRFSPVEPRRSPHERTCVLSIGRLTEKKGIQYAIRAVARVIATGRRLSYNVAGDGPLRPELERLVRGLGVGEHVHLLGWRSHDEVIASLQQSHILLAPSVTAADGNEEGIPNAVKEAMALGIPVLCTRHGGIPELVEDSVSGFLVRERDVEALAERLTWLVDHPEAWISMGRAGRERIKSAFDVDRLNDELAACYQRILVSGGAPTGGVPAASTARAIP